jgi:flagellar basal-body rod protein FlgG
MLSLEIGATGMLAQQMHVEVISNNIANMTTTGFKRQRPEFQDLIYQNIIKPGTSSTDAGNLVPSGIQLGLGVKPGSVYRIHEQGALQMTENNLDVAISGNGYFQIDLPSGETGYTRAGNFGLNNLGQIVTAQGLVVQPGITIPQDAVDITINASGEVFADIDGQVAQQNLGQLQLANFVNKSGLEAIGDNLFVETESSGAPIVAAPQAAGFGKLIQGARESSNVDVVAEITNLITAQRAYEMNSKVIQTSDEMLGTTAQLR